MSTVGGGVNIVRDGLVMYLDAANTKSLVDVPSTNLIKNSQQFQFWNQYQSTVSANTTTAPDGTITADTNIETSGLTGNRGVQQMFTGMLSGQTYTFSVYAKNFNGRDIEMGVYQYPGYTNWYRSNFYLQSGTTATVSSSFGSATRTNTSIVNVGNGWYRCSISGYITGATQLQPNINFLNSGNTAFYTGDGVSGVYLWGGQFESGPVATTYIPTTAAAASRIPTWTDISRGGNNGVLNTGFTYNYSNGGGLVFNGISTYIQSPFAPLGINATWTISSWFKAGTQTTDNGIICLGYLPVITLQTSGNIRLLWYNGVTYPQILTSGINYGDDTPHNVTATYDGVTVKLYVDSILKGSNVNNVHAIYDLVRLGIEYNNGNKILNGLIYNGLVYTRALSTSEVLQNYNASKTRFGL